MAKKNANQKRRRRRRRSGRIRAVQGFFFCVLTIAALLAAATVFFKVETIVVTGNSPYSQEEIAAATGITPGNSLIFFEKNRAIRQLLAACPYLEEIRIHRKLPDTLEVIVTECRPAAVIETSEGGYIIDANGKLLEKIDAPQSAGLCRITGVELVAPAVGKTMEISEKEKKKPIILALNTFQDDDILNEIGILSVEELYSISFTYTDRFTVKIGTAEDLDRKLRYMHTLIDEKLSSTAKGTIDVSDVQTARFNPAQ